jgi:hypothetical protein
MPSVKPLCKILPILSASIRKAPINFAPFALSANHSRDAIVSSAREFISSLISILTLSSISSFCNISFKKFSLFLISCTFEKAEPLSVGCDTSLFYATDIKPIIDSKCVVCHNSAGSGTGDFTDFNVLKSKVESGIFKTRVFTLKDMPEASSTPLTEVELEKLRCWVEQGALNN